MRALHLLLGAIVRPVLGRLRRLVALMADLNAALRQLRELLARAADEPRAVGPGDIDRIVETFSALDALLSTKRAEQSAKAWCDGHAAAQRAMRLVVADAWRGGYAAAERDYTEDDREPHESKNPYEG